MQELNLKHQTHKETVIKFLLLIGVLVAYFAYLSWKFDLATGGLVSALTWSFFVLCTPVADAGFLLDFPIRLIFKIKMFVTEVAVWALAIVINVITLWINPGVYENTALTSIFYKILVTPFPYWLIIILCGIGTFLSIYFGDEMMDVASHRQRAKHHRHNFKYKVIAVTTLFISIFLIYHHLITDMGLNDFL